MNFDDKETFKRFKRKLYNAYKEVGNLSTFLQVHNEDDGGKEYRRGCEAQDELDYMAKRLSTMFDNLKESDNGN